MKGKTKRSMQKEKGKMRLTNYASKPIGVRRTRFHRASIEKGLERKKIGPNCRIILQVYLLYPIILIIYS
jgi:hypothetical protein